MKKLMTSFLAVTCALFGCSLSACTDDKETAETSPETSAESTEPINYGTLAIDDVFAWVGYPENIVIHVFSKPELAEKLTYEYDHSGISIDPETNCVTAIKAGRYEVTAKSDHFSAEFIVRAEEVDLNSAKFSAVNYTAAAENRAAQWAAGGRDGKTTLFIGDSFFDTAYWTGFYTDSYTGKDALCLGISATTTYDWEQWLGGWLGATKPKSIVTHIGTNNVYDDGDSIFAALSAYQRMFLLMHEQFPDTHIYWFGVTQRAHDNEKIERVSEINAKMQKWCDALDFITYIDTPSLIDKNMLNDGVHPKPENYSIFVDALAKTDIAIEEAK